jgi:putative endonuclease
MPKKYYVYIMTNQHNTVLYTGVTNDLWKRVSQHKLKLLPGFTSKYNINKLVYYEMFDDVNAAIAREKQIKAGSRLKKVDLLSAMNPEWKELCQE